MGKELTSDISESSLEHRIKEYKGLVRNVNLASVLNTIPVFLMTYHNFRNFDFDSTILKNAFDGFPDNLERYVPAAFFTLSVYLFVNVLSTGFVSYRINFLKRPGKSRESLEKTIEATKNPYYSLMLESVMHEIDGDYDKGLECLARLSDITKKYGNPMTHTDRFMGFLVPPLIDLLSPLKPELHEQISRAAIHYRYGNSDKSARIVGELSEKHPEYKSELALLAALWYKSIGDQKKSGEFFEKSLNAMLESGLEFRKITESRNEVLECVPKRFIRDKILLKRSQDPDKIFREDSVVRLVRSAYAKKYLDTLADPDEIPIEETLSVFGSPATLAIRRLREETLEQVLQRGDRSEISEQYKKAVTSLARLMISSTSEYNTVVKSGNIEDNPHDYEEEFNRRVISRFGNNHPFIIAYLKQIEEINCLVDKSGIKVLAHRDSSDFNLMTNGYVIDFETAGTADCVLDIATATASLENEIAYAIFDHAYSILSEEFGGMSYETSKELFSRVRTNNIICQMGGIVSRGSQQSIAKAKRHFSFARENLSRRSVTLAKQFEDYVGCSRYALSV